MARVIAFEIVLLSSILADIRVISNYIISGAILDFWISSGLGVLLMAPLKGLTPRTSG